MFSMLEEASRAVGPLIPGIPVFALNGEIDLQSRLQICSGTTFVDSDIYVPNAMIPTADWRALSPEEFALLTPEGGARDDSESAALMMWELPPDLMEGLCLPAQAIGKRNKPYIAANALKLFEFKNAEDRVVKYCIQRGFDNVRLLGSSWTEPNLPTVGVGLHKKRVGLHVDSYISRPLSARSGFPSRLCINVGPEPRYLMFCNISVAAIRRMPELSGSDSPIDLVIEFFKKFPEYGILKLQINPGEAYIAPVEILIHEGTSVGKQFIDVQTTLLGDFARTKATSLTSPL